MPVIGVSESGMHNMALCLSLAVWVSLAQGDFDRPPKLDFKTHVDYIDWVNRLVAQGKGPNGWSKYDGFVPKRNAKGEMSGGLPDLDDETVKQCNARKGIWQESDFPELAACIKANQKYLDIAAKASESRDAWEPIDKDTRTLMEALLPYLSGFRSACKLMHAQAWMKQPNQTSALDKTHRTVLRMARHVGQSPFLISGLVSLAMRSSVYASVRAALQTDQLKGPDFANWYRSLESTDSGPMNWQHQVLSEWTIELDAVQFAFPSGKPSTHNIKSLVKLAQSDDKPVSPKLIEALAASNPQRAAATLDAYFPALFDATKDPIRWGKVDDLNRTHERFAEKLKADPIADWLAPNLSRAYQLRVRSESEVRGTLLTLAILAHHDKHKEWPKSLDAIDPKLGLSDLKTNKIDPMTGKQFHYEVKDGEATLYSLGVDGKDDGGQHDEKFGEAGKGGDFVFWPPPKD